MSGWLKQLCREAGALELTDLSGGVRERVKHVAADTIGVMIGGSHSPEIQSWASGTTLGPLPNGDAEVAAVRGLKTEASMAALINGSAATFLELDEGIRPTGHPGSHVVPASLAAAQTLGSSGAELLTSIVAGYEVAARLFEMYRLRHPVHPHGHVGAVGAAVAVARLSGIDPVSAARVALSAPTITTWDTCLEGATVRNTLTGFAAAMGVHANRLVDSGFSGSWSVPEVLLGNLLGQELPPVTSTVRNSDEPFRIMENYFKFHSCCALSHTAIDAVLDLPHVRASDVVGVTVETIQNSLKIEGQAVDNELSARFSLPYAVATALVHRHALPSAFKWKEDVARLARRVSVTGSPELEEMWPQAAPARVTIESIEGTLVGLSENPYGHFRNPPTVEKLRQKFIDLVGMEEASSMYERLMALEELDDCGSIIWDGTS